MIRGRRILLNLLMMVAIALPATAQQTETAATATTATTTTATSTAAETSTLTPEQREELKLQEKDAENKIATDPDARRYEVRKQFTRLIHAHRWQLGQTLALEPTLLKNKEFVANYPELEQFLIQNPEVSRDVHFYMQEIGVPRATANAVDQVLEAIAMIGVTLLISFAFMWLVRTVIEQRRWGRLSRQQAEVHNKILDRFGSSDELLQYIKSPAGSKFLESAPIPVRASEPTVQNAPTTRILWAIQIGVIAAIASFGMILVSLRLSGDAALTLFTLGAIGFCVGAGFIASAFVSVVVSRRLGLWQGPLPESTRTTDDAGGMR
jgi:hypothetical protein